MGQRGAATLIRFFMLLTRGRARATTLGVEARRGALLEVRDRRASKGHHRAAVGRSSGALVVEIEHSHNSSGDEEEQAKADMPAIKRGCL